MRSGICMSFFRRLYISILIFVSSPIWSVLGRGPFVKNFGFTGDEIAEEACSICLFVFATRIVPSGVSSFSMIAVVAVREAPGSCSRFKPVSAKSITLWDLDEAEAETEMDGCREWLLRVFDTSETSDEFRESDGDEPRPLIFIDIEPKLGRFTDGRRVEPGGSGRCASSARIPIEIDPTKIWEATNQPKIKSPVSCYKRKGGIWSTSTVLTSSVRRRCSAPAD